MEAKLLLPDGLVQKVVNYGDEDMFKLSFTSTEMVMTGHGEMMPRLHVGCTHRDQKIAEETLLLTLEANGYNSRTKLFDTLK